MVATDGEKGNKRGGFPKSENERQGVAVEGCGTICMDGWMDVHTMDPVKIFLLPPHRQPLGPWGSLAPRGAWYGRGRGARDRCEPLMAMQQNTERKKNLAVPFRKVGRPSQQGTNHFGQLLRSGQAEPCSIASAGVDAMWVVARRSLPLPCSLPNVPLPELGSATGSSHWGRQHFAALQVNWGPGPPRVQP